MDSVTRSIVTALLVARDRDKPLQDGAFRAAYYVLKRLLLGKFRARQDLRIVIRRIESRPESHDLAEWLSKTLREVKADSDTQVLLASAALARQAFILAQLDTILPTCETDRPTWLTPMMPSANPTIVRKRIGIHVREITGLGLAEAKARILVRDKALALEEALTETTAGPATGTGPFEPSTISQEEMAKGELPDDAFEVTFQAGVPIGAENGVTRIEMPQEMLETSLDHPPAPGIETGTEAVVAAPIGEPPVREIVVTACLDSGGVVAEFRPKTSYSLHFRVTAPSENNLISGDRKIRDIPESGLDAIWVVTSANVELLGVSSASGSVTRLGNTWLAQFELRIPSCGDSATVMLDVRTTSSSGELTLALLVGGEEYRNLTIRLGFGAQVENDIVATAPRHLNLPPSPDWTTPPEHLEVNVFGQAARISTVHGRNDYGTVEWMCTATTLNNPIIRVREALENFRVTAEAHLDNLDTAEMAQRLGGGAWRLDDRWDGATCQVDTEHAGAMAKLSASERLRALANEGYNLFAACFPEGSPLSDIIRQLAPGSRLDFIWTSRGDPNWVSHVPWSLMYLDPVGAAEPVDCERFLGLRMRIRGKAWEPRAPSRALGAPAAVNALNFLYWGNDPNDEVAKESQWQREQFRQWQPRQCFIPDSDGKDPKRQVIEALEAPEPEPAAILYFYCHCNLPDPTHPVLQFSDGASPNEVVKASDIYQGRLASGPLVFANACMTVKADPHGTSELEDRFFKRDIRAFLGTETQVPVKLASRFAWLFFQFFLRLVDPAPMAAGEALTQARKFLWTQYRNPGGLFYCLVNQYNLYLASDEELAQLPRRQA